MRRALMIARVEWLLVAAQIAVVAAVLGLPNLHRVGDFATTGFTSGENAVAVITAVLWAGAILLAVVVGWASARRAWRGKGTGLLPVVAVVVGLGCLGAGVVHHQAASFQSCCGSLDAAQSALEGTR